MAVVLNFCFFFFVQVAVHRTDTKHYVLWKEMLDQMNMFYTNNHVLHPVRLILQKQLYAIEVDNLWVRAELIEKVDAVNVSY